MKTSTRTFEIPTNKGTALSLKIHEDITIRADNLHLETWGSSLVLARLLHSIQIQIPNLTTSPPHRQNRSCRLSSTTDQAACAGPVLELGAGTGLVGLAAAAVWKTHVTLTDLPPIVPALQKNIALNGDLLLSNGGCASSGELDWKDPSLLRLHPPDEGDGTIEAPAERNKVQVILAADTIYDSCHPEMLARVISTWLRAGPDSRVLIAYPVRVAYLEEIRELWERMQGVGMEVCVEGKEELPEKDWDDETLIEWCVWKWNE